MSNVAIDLTKTVKEIITTMKTAIDNLNSDVATNKTAIDNLKTQILEAVYPVGSVYVSLTNSSNPADILGFGTWEALPAGYGLVAQGTATAEDGTTLTFTAGSKTGEFKHQLTVGELPKIEGRFPGVIFDNYEMDISGVVNMATGFSKSLHCTTNNTEYGYIIRFGDNQHHNNISPGIAVYCWHRIN